MIHNIEVPFTDLKAQHESIYDEVFAAIEQVVKSCDFAGGPFVEQFDREFAAFCETRYSISVSNGTEALWLTLLALGIGEGHEVITVPNSFIATAEAISYCGARPVFVDSNPITYTMNPELIESAITPHNENPSILARFQPPAYPFCLFRTFGDKDLFLK